jgi:hypothetical protein
MIHTYIMSLLAPKFVCFDFLEFQTPGNNFGEFKTEFENSLGWELGAHKGSIHEKPDVEISCYYPLKKDIKLRIV